MDRKLLIFLVVFFAFLYSYQKFILEPMLKKNVPPQKATQTAQAPASPPVPAATQPAPQSTPVPVVAGKAQKVSVDTPFYHAEFSSQGAVLTSFRLKKYADDFGKPLEMIPQETKEFPLRLDFEDKSLTALSDAAVYTLDKQNISISQAEKATLRFEYFDGTNHFTKHFEFEGNGYILRCSVDAARDQNRIPVRLAWSPGLETAGSYVSLDALRQSRGLVNNGEKVEHWEARQIKEFKKIGATIRWAGVENNYFAGIFIPSNQPVDAYMTQLGDGDKKAVHNVSVLVAGQKAEPLEMSLFIGPKDYVLLKHLGMDLEDAVNFGFFGPIAKGLFFTLHYFYRFTSNYGWSIVLLTILIKIIFTPFTQMSFASMKKMQQMQPELKKIQDKYAKMKNDDPRKQNMNVEITQLHKRYGVNPLGGCLPMLLQMPFLFAFYSILSNAIELRKAPFVFWLQDLSRPDPYHVTPIIMGATMLLQQRMTPSTDPMQKNMMYVMPIMFTAMSFRLQSGLVLYWLLSNVLAVAHQYYFQRQQKNAALKEKNA